MECSQRNVTVLHYVHYRSNARPLYSPLATPLSLCAFETLHPSSLLHLIRNYTMNTLKKGVTRQSQSTGICQVRAEGVPIPILIMGITNRTLLWFTVRTPWAPPT